MLHELEDFNLFPSVLQKYQMENIGIMVDILQLYKPIAIKIDEILAVADNKKIIDLCGGSGLPAIYISKKLKKSEVTTTLTDIYPQSTPTLINVNYSPESIDVFDIVPDDSNLYTMYNSFHHFTEHGQKKLINRMVSNNSPFIFVEILKQGLLSLLQVFVASTVGVILLTPIIRPFKWHRILFTYILPVNVLTVLTDGIISVFKSKSQKNTKNT